MANTPTPAATVAVPASAGSNKSVPASAVAVPASVKKWLWLTVVAIAVAIGIARIASIARSDNPEQGKSTGAMVLLMPANGDSPHVSAPDAGYAPSFTGYGFTSRCVYSDGRDLEYPCVEGPIVYYYVRDTSGKANTVTYKFVRPK